MCKGDFSFLIPILNKQIKHFFCCRFIQLLQLLQFLSCDLFKLFVLLHLFSFFFFFTPLNHKTAILVCKLTNLFLPIISTPMYSFTYPLDFLKSTHTLLFLSLLSTLFSSLQISNIST